MIMSHGIGEYALIAAVAFAVSMLVTARMIPLMKHRQFGQFIREEGPQAHLSKAGTPTMGGIAFIIGITVAIVISMFMKGSDTTGKVAILLSMFAFGADSLRPRESQHARPPCPSPTPRVHSNSRPSSW